MKRIMFVLILLSLAVFTACTQDSDGSTSLFTTNEDVIAFQVLAAASLLPTANEPALTTTVQAQPLSYVLNETEEEPVDDDPLLTTIEPYIALVEKFLSTDNGLTVQVEASALEDYDLMMTFQTRGLLGEVQTYVIHYNMTLEDEDDDESEFALEGIMIINDQHYILTGEREVEEGEESVEFIAKLDDLNYVELEYKVESEEIEFEIKVVLNGEIVSETKIEIEFEEDEITIELEFMEGESKGTYEFKYEMEGDQLVLKIEFDVEIDGIHVKGEITVSVHIDEVTGETTYRMFVEPEEGDAYEKDVPRTIDDDDDDDDDDDEADADDDDDEADADDDEADADDDETHEE